MGDDIAEMLGGFIALTLMLGVVAFIAFFVGLVVVPVGLAGAGTLYYLYNIHLPEKRRKEALARTNALYRQAQQLSPSWEHLETALIDAGIESAVLHRIAKTLYDQEGLRPPVLPPVSDDQIKLARYQDVLERFINNAQPEHYQTFERHLIWALSEYEPEDQDKPQMFRSERSRTKVEIERLMQRFINDDGLFQPLVEQINQNFFDEGEVYPSKSKHDDYAWRYLKETPLLDLADVSEAVSLSDRQYHTYLLGSSGSGKTNLIENIIAHDLASDEDCCVVVIDSQTQLTDKLARLDIEDTTYLTPKFELALNLFAVGYDEMKGRGIDGETLINKTVGLLSFVLEGMMGAEFTNPQKTIFQYVIQLVISIPGGNINTFMDVLAEGGHERHADAIAKLDDVVSVAPKRTRDQPTHVGVVLGEKDAGCLLIQQPSTFLPPTTNAHGKRSVASWMGSCSTQPSVACFRPLRTRSICSKSSTGRSSLSSTPTNRCSMTRRPPSLGGCSSR